MFYRALPRRLTIPPYPGAVISALCDNRCRLQLQLGFCKFLFRASRRRRLVVVLRDILSSLSYLLPRDYPKSGFRNWNGCLRPDATHLSIRGASLVL